VIVHTEVVEFLFGLEAMVKKRVAMTLETRSRLLKAARATFTNLGYAESSMDDLTSQVGLTRGALYHHFGSKKGLLQAVIAQIEGEMTLRLSRIVEEAKTTWDGFVDECIAYINMALELEIQRIVLLDGPAVLGDPSRWALQNSCLKSTQRSIQRLIDENHIHPLDALATARLLNGALLSASLWIANSEEPHHTSRKAVDSFMVLASGLRLRNT
jgi:AcrR family transcriptional regulator